MALQAMGGHPTVERRELANELIKELAAKVITELKGLNP